MFRISGSVWWWQVLSSGIKRNLVCWRSTGVSEEHVAWVILRPWKQRQHALPETLADFQRTTQSCIPEDMFRNVWYSTWRNTDTRYRSWLRHYARSRRLRRLIPMSLFSFSIYLILPAALRPSDLLSLLTEMSIRDIFRGKERPARKADNHTAICELMWNSWSLNPIDLHGLLDGQLYCIRRNYIAGALCSL
jgi:hypothetical protein